MGATYGGYLWGLPNNSLQLRDGGYLIPQYYYVMGGLLISYYNYVMGATYGGYLIIHYNYVMGTSYGGYLHNNLILLESIK